MSLASEYWIGYCRVSSQIQKDGASLSYQTNAIQDFWNKFCTIDTTKVKTVWVLEIASAKLMKNQKFLLQIFKDISLMNPIPQVKLFVYHSSRFSRDEIKGKEFLEELLNQGISVYSITENLNSTFHLKEWMEAIQNASNESKLLSKRIKDGFQEKKRLGGSYQSCGIKNQLFKRVWIPTKMKYQSNQNQNQSENQNQSGDKNQYENKNVNAESILNIPKLSITNFGKSISFILYSFYQRYHKNAFSKLLKKLQDLDSNIYENYSLQDEDYEWNFDQNKKMDIKDLEKVLKIWKPKFVWTPLLIERLILYAETNMQ